MSTILLAGAISVRSVLAVPLIIDHTSVDKYNDIPQYWIDQVKKMWVSIPGEAHSSGYRIGLNLLENSDSRFQVNILESGIPEPRTDKYLRFSRATWGDLGNPSGWRYDYGEEDWYCSQIAIDRTKAGITYSNASGPGLFAMGFGWGWDMTSVNDPGGLEDPIYRVKWAGSSVGGPDGNVRWGLDSGDTSLTGNHVCMDTYLQATQGYIDYCKANNFFTKFFFTTGPIDGVHGEAAYQRELKHKHIRDYVASTADGILFDYADILSWSNLGAQNTETWVDRNWTSHTFQFIHPDNMLDLDGKYVEDGDYIGQRGSVRLSKAVWYMLARMAGWDGNPEGIVYFLVTEKNPQKKDSYVLPLTKSADIAAARNIIKGLDSKLILAKIDYGSGNGIYINEDLLNGKRIWNWSVTEFLGFSSMTPEILDGWPTYVNDNLDEWMRITQGKIGFWNYTVSREISISELNIPPSITPIGSRAIHEGEPLLFDVSVNDPNANDIISLVSSILPTNATLTQKSPRVWEFKWQTDFNSEGTYVVTFTANDGHENSMPVKANI